MSRLFDHTVALYTELSDEAENGTFTGSKVAMFRRIGVSQGYYTVLFDTLTEMGCIEQLQRGTASTPSIIVLHSEPTREKFDEAYKSALTKSTPLDTLRQQIENLNRRLPQTDLSSTIISLDTRLADLEGRVDAIERQGR